MRIFVDLDEVLCDFVGGALAVHRPYQALAELQAARTPGVWDLPSFLGITLEEFWEPIHAQGEQFWLGLRPLPWINSVMGPATYHDRTCQPRIITTPSDNPHSYSAKIKWILRYVGPCEASTAILTHDKSQYACPDAVLIDDRDKNVQDFIDAGGQGIVFPTIGNSLWKLADDPLTHVHMELDRICT